MKIEIIPGEVGVPFFKTPEEEQRWRDWWQENVTKALLAAAHERQRLEVELAQVKQERDQLRDIAWKLHVDSLFLRMTP